MQQVAIGASVELTYAAGARQKQQRACPGTPGLMAIAAAAFLSKRLNRCGIFARTERGHA